MKIRGIAIIAVLYACMAPALPPIGTAPAEELKWTDLRAILGRLEAEYARLEVVYREADRLENACEDLRTVQAYPPKYTRLKEKREIKAVEKMIRDAEKRIGGFRRAANKLNEPLTKAIAMLKELIYEDQLPAMFRLLVKESKSRVRRIILLKRKINETWRLLDTALNRLYRVANRPAGATGDRDGFEAEFFQVLYHNLGMSSERFLDKLHHYKDLVCGDMDLTTLSGIADRELDAVRARFKRGEFVILERDLQNLASRFRGKINTDGMEFYLAHVLQILGKTEEAIKHYSLIDKTSPYYLDALAGILQSLYEQGKYSRVDFMFDKLQKEFEGRAGMNKIYYVVAQAHYELRRDKDIIELTTRAEKGAPYYLGMLYVLGQSYARSGDYKTARTVFRKIINAKRVPDTDEGFKGRARIALAHLDYIEKLYPRALKAYIGLLEDQALFAEAIEGISWCYLALGNHTKAEIALKRLVNQAPDKPSGCDALNLLARNYLKTAQVKWQSKQEEANIKKRIQRYRRMLARRRRDGELDSATVRDVEVRLDEALALNASTESAGYENIAEFYRKSKEAIFLLVASYQSGEFIHSPFKNLREEILLRIRDLYDKSRADRKAHLRKDYFISRQQQERRRRTILETVIKARMFKVQMLLEKREWEGEYRKYHMQKINRQMADVRVDTLLTDSARAESLAVLGEDRVALSLALDSSAAWEQKEILKELNRLRESMLDETQEAFTLYYLGEVYYRFAQDEFIRKDEAFETKIEAFQAAFEAFQAGKSKQKPVQPEPPELDYSTSKRYFRQLINRFPESKYTDAAYYGIMFCNMEEGNKELAIKAGEELVRRFPQSQYTPQAYLVLGEIYFDEAKLDLALARYREVLKFPDSKWFDKALYKMGWTYYRLSETRRAISAFFYLILEQDEMTEGGMDIQLFTKSLLTKESMDYIAISFAESDTSEADMTGLKKTRRFVRRIRNAYIGSKILHKLGDVYREQLKYEHAIATYRELTCTASSNATNRKARPRTSWPPTRAG
jgi:tetratricopeptide (TPR) repeat protein